MSKLTLDERLAMIKAFFDMINSPEIKKEILESIDKINKELPSHNMLFFVDSLEKYIDDLEKK